MYTNCTCIFTYKINSYINCVIVVHEYFLLWHGVETWLEITGNEHETGNFTFLQVQNLPSGSFHQWSHQFLSMSISHWYWHHQNSVQTGLPFTEHIVWSASTFSHNMAMRSTTNAAKDHRSEHRPKALNIISATWTAIFSRIYLQW